MSAIHFAEGQNVGKGSRSSRSIRGPFEAALQQAKAVLARDTRSASNAEAQRSATRICSMRGLIPRDQYETQKASLASLQATLAADQAAIDTATLNLQYSRIRRRSPGGPAR